VIERDRAVGGLCQTRDYNGFKFDLGGHRFISEDQGLVEEIERLLQDDLLRRKKRCVLRYQGQEITYPLSLSELLRKLPLSLLYRGMKDYFKSRLRTDRPDPHTLEQWLINQYGPHLYQAFFEPYTSKLWGLHPRELCPDWADERIPPLRLSRILTSYPGKRGAYRHYLSHYFYPKGGIGQIFEYMAREIKGAGGQIWLQCRPIRLYQGGDRSIKAIEIVKGEEKMTLDLDWLITTIPLPELVPLIHPPLHPRLREQVNKLKYRSLRFLNLLIDHQRISDNTWIYVPEGSFIISRIQEPKNRSPYNAPEGYTSLILEIPCKEGDHIWTADEVRLYQHCLEELAALGIDVRGKVTDYFFTQARYAYPIYSLDFKGTRDSLLKALEGIKNLFLIGRQALFQYIFMDQAMLQGMAIAHRIREGD